MRYRALMLLALVSCLVIVGISLGLGTPRKVEGGGLPVRNGPFHAEAPTDSGVLHSAAAERTIVGLVEEPGGASIRVVDSSGRAVPNAKVHAPWMEKQRVVSGEGCEVSREFAGLGFTAFAAGYLPREGLVPREGEVLVELSAGREVRFRVLDDEGRPIQGARVAVSSDCMPMAKASGDFAELVVCPSPSRVSQVASSGDGGLARVAGLPHGLNLRFDVAKAGYVRGSDETIVKAEQDEIEVRLIPLAYVATQISCGDLMGWRTDPERGNSKSVSVALSALAGELRHGQDESTVFWLGTHTDEGDGFKEFQVYSRAAGALRIRAPIRRFRGLPIETDLIEVEGCGQRPAGHGLLHVVQDRAAGGPGYELRHGDLVLIPRNVEGVVWTMSVPVDVEIAVPAGSYTLHAQTPILHGALGGLPQNFEVAAGEVRSLRVSVTSDIVDLMIQPRTATGASLTAYALDIEKGSFSHSAMILRRDGYELRVPSGPLRLSVRSMASGELIQMDEFILADKTISPVLK